MKTISSNHVENTAEKQLLNGVRIMNGFRMALALQELSDTLTRAGVDDRINLNVVDFDREHCLLNCVGDVPSEVVDFMREVGEQFDMPKNWINIDYCMPHNSVENFEKTVGKLHFEKNPDDQIGIFNLNFLEDRDLLRVKLMVVETEYAAVEYGGQFDRFSDIRDILDLKSKLDLDYIGMEKLANGYLMGDEVFDVISAYEFEEEAGVNKLIAEMQRNSDLDKDLKELLDSEKEMDADERDM